MIDITDISHVPFHPLVAEGDSVTLGGQYLVRPSRPSDLPALQQLFACARRFMAQSGNPTQWVNGYPADDILLADIQAHASHIVERDGQVVATFALRTGADPTYAVIYDGAWPSSGPYATIHRVASNGEVHGIMQLVLRYAMRRHHTLRIDTHRDNHPMRHLILKAGFRYCGIIHTATGGERLAYQYDKP